MAGIFERDVYCLLGLPFDAVDLPAAIRLVREAAARRTPCFISTANLNFLVGCRADSRFRASVIDSELSVVDGMPQIWVARLLGIPIRERVAGADLFERLREDASARLAVYFFGGRERVAEAACRKLNAGPSGLACVDYRYPGFGSIEDMSGDATIADINASGADSLIVSLGAKKGQAWIERNRARISVPVISHLGAVVNFAAGTAARAPKWMRRAGLEWLWRIKEEPELWRRYLSDGLVFLRLLLTRVLPYAWFIRRHRPAGEELAAAAAEMRDAGGEFVIRLRGAWVRQNLEPLRDLFSQAVLAGKDLRLDLERVCYVDAAFLGLVILLQGHQTRRGRRLALASLQEPVRRIVAYGCAEYLCPAPA